MNFADTNCINSNLGGVLLTPSQIDAHKAQIHEHWTLIDNNKALVRKFILKGFVKTTAHANLATFIGDQQDSHPEIWFG